MTRLGGIAAAACLSGLVLLAGCGAPPPDAAGATTAAASTGSAAAPTPTEPVWTTTVAGGRADAVAAWKKALGPLRRAKSSDYWMLTQTFVTSSHRIQTSRTYRIDTTQDVAELTVSYEVAKPNREPAVTEVWFATTRKYAFLDIYPAKGESEGWWAEDPSELPPPEIPVVLDDLSVVPTGIDRFQPQEVIHAFGHVQIVGVLPAEDGLHFLGASSLLLDEEFAESLTGFVRAAAILDDDDGQLREFHVLGEGHNLSSKVQDVPYRDIWENLDVTESRLEIDALDIPMEFDLPDEDDLEP